MQNTPTLTLAHSYSVLSAAFSILFTLALVGAWLGWVYWNASSDIKNAERVAEIKMTKERAFTARLEAAERNPSSLDAKQSR